MATLEEQPQGRPRQHQGSDRRRDEEPFGDTLGQRRQGVFRIGLLNCGGLHETRHNQKNDELSRMVTDKGFHVMGINEANQRWHQLRVEDRIKDRARQWWSEYHVSYSYFKDYEMASAHQYGGECVLSTGQAVHRLINSGSDPTGMGRWCWTRYRGQTGKVVRVTVAYRPVHNIENLNSVYQQHKSYYTKKNQANKNPRETIIEDLCKELRKALAQGEHLVVMIDANEDVRNGYVSRKFAEEVGLTEIILERHKGTPPATTNDGQLPIDGIFVSESIARHEPKCGYLPMQDSPYGADHRVLWIDLPVQEVFGNSFNSTRPEARRLKCSDPRIVKKFNSAYLTKLQVKTEKGSLIERADRLNAQVKDQTWSSEMAEEWEAIDQERMKAMEQAEKKCRKLKMGNIPWSPALQEIMWRIRARSLILRRTKGARINGRYIRRQLTKAQIPLEQLKSTKEQATQNLKMELKALKEFRKTAFAQRTTYLEELAEAIAKEKGEKKEQVIKQLHTRERQREAARAIRSTHQAGTKGRLVMVIAPDQEDPNQRNECTTKETIEAACMQENKRRFWQADKTPFLQEPLLTKVGRRNEGPGATEILQTGAITLDAEDQPLDDATKALMKNLQRPPGVRDLTREEIEITKEVHIAGWKRAKERTSSGDKIMHFGHGIASTKDDSIAKFEAQMRNIPLMSGYAPRRWQRCLCVEIQKKPGDINVENLRTIALFTADCNANNKHIGRGFMKNAEAKGLIDIAQHGSRPNKAAITQVVNKKLTLDIFRQTKTNGAVGSNDAKSCYDRIVHSVAMLAMRRTGYPKEPLDSMFGTIQQFELFIRTLFGDSDTGFMCSDMELPIQSILQGNGAGPHIWAAVSSAILKALRDKGIGAKFTYAIDGSSLTIASFMFVDDHDNIVTEDTNSELPTAEEVTKQMQESFDTWQALLHATGGALVADKSNWTMIHFKWNKDGTFYYASQEQSPGEVSMLDASGQRKQLKRLEPTVGDRMLGVRLSVDGKDPEELEFRIEQASKWSKTLISGHLPRHLVWQDLQSVAMKQLEYPLPATTFTRAECNNISRPVLIAALPRSGTVRTFPRALVHATLKHQGLGIPDLYITQGIEHIALLVNTGYSNSDTTGRLIQASGQAMLLELGCQHPMFDQDYTKFKHIVSDSWMKSTWQFMQEHHIKMQTNFPSIKLSCPGDKFLIQELAKAYSNSLAKLNRCRLFLQVTTLAEIVTADGKSIIQSAWEGRPKTTKTNKFFWPGQGNPPPADWKLFREAIGKVFQVDQQSRKLARPLNEWDLPECDWNFYYNQEEERLYERQGHGWGVHIHPNGGRRTRRQTNTFDAATTSFEARLPILSVKVTVEQAGSKLYITGISKVKQPKTTTITKEAPSAEMTFDEYSDSLPYERTWAWSHKDQHSQEQLQQIVNAVKQGRCRMVSDGSFKDNFGTSSFVLESTTDKVRIEADNVIPGPANSQSAYRSELGGLYGMVFLLTTAIEFFHGKDATSITGTVQVGCDGKSALEKCFDPEVHANCSTPDFDMIIAIRRRLHQFNRIQWKHEHIMGHRDDDTPFEELSEMEQANVRMDRRAKDHWKRQHEAAESKPEPPIHNLFLAPWTVWINGTMVVKAWKESLHDHCAGIEALKYWTAKKRFGEEDAKTVDWEATKKAMTTSTIGQRREMTKHTSGHFGVNKMMYNWKKKDSMACPRCNAPVEDAKHVIQCPQPEAREVYQGSMLKVHLWMRDEETDDDIREAIFSRLMSWGNKDEDSDSADLPTGVQFLIQQQDKMGWYAAFTGAWVKGWAEAQHAYYKSIQVQNEGLNWLAALIKKLWQVSWDMWQHRNSVATIQAEAQRKEDLEAAIRQEYAERFDNIPTHLQRLTAGTDVEKTLSLSLADQETWLKHVQEARKNPEETEVRNLRLQRTMMNTRFQPTTRR